MPEPENPNPNPDAPGTNPQEPGQDADVFSREYVETLRKENAARRTEVEPLRLALREAYLEKGSAGVLHDPVPWDDAFTDEETGLPDVEKIKAAAEALAQEKPHLARVRGDAGQGFRGEQSDSVDLASMLRQGA